MAEAARRLGVSVATVKRRIAAGTLEAEQLTRPQGIEYRVRLPRGVPAPLSDVSPPLGERRDSVPAPLNGTAQDVSAAISAAVAPLVERLAVQDATIAEQGRVIERQAGEIAALREERGRHVAELVAGRAEATRVAAERDAAESSRRRDTRRLSIALAVAGALAVAATLVPAWVR